MTTKFKPVRAGIIAALAAISIGSLNLPVTYADVPVVSESFSAGDPIKAPLQKPLWTASFDKNASSVVSGDGLLFTFEGGKLVALNVQNGKKLFTYGSKLRPGAAYLNGVVYGVTDSGQVYAVSAKTGKQVWKSAAGITDANAPVVIKDTVLVSNKNAFIALDAATGKQRWKAVEDQAENQGTVATEADGILYVTYWVQGALTSSQLDAIDLKTGKILWKKFKQYAPLTIQNGLVYSIADQYSFDDADPKRELNIAVLDAKTGKTKETQTYSWTLKSQPPYQGGSGSAILNGKDLYIATDRAVMKFDITAYKKDGKPLKTWNVDNTDKDIIGSVHDNRVFFKNSSKPEITGMKLADSMTFNFRTDNPPVQTDIYGNGVYIGQSDGVLHGYNLQTTFSVFTVNTGSRNYGPTLRSGNTLIIQAKDTGKLIAVPVPKALQ
ncbi:PQQ-binding-like beta-propeller repeat protein [Paenibacillus donghaensis]|uniref:PQQ-binding-like beta-propeller repeat protein n=1 Tax=Paenibacillus donghaensis TaxID=414771 RepID=UPI001884509F|nr:PQQ-binding-like beta-propeller repeat protein [Paenibacillus donghaensis]MBE9915834.1 PQQ-binding-like beta-propeller repeat protein [Paenibacillus donghaensis]